MRRAVNAGAGVARNRTRVFEERQVVARRAMLVSVEEMVGAGVVLVDRLGDQAKTQHAGVEVDVGKGVAGDRGDVMDAVQPHECLRTESDCVRNYITSGRPVSGRPTRGIAASAG